MYVPIFCRPETDLVVDISGRLIRLQVKTNSGADAYLRFSSWNRTTDTYIDRVDWLAFYAPHHGVTAFLKPEEAGKYPTLRYDTPEDRKHPTSMMRFARDYPINRVIKEATT